MRQGGVIYPILANRADRGSRFGSSLVYFDLTAKEPYQSMAFIKIPRIHLILIGKNLRKIRATKTVKSENLRISELVGGKR
ncbi:hypothetical protein OUZ56_003587 [Daphnia magna]|uniref:Uncharacterized protein n=1 Tax=Daphnia magna TaxID=35525 RepID=A0ABR0A956_9CRUS|nr:hypothetical protein OUZ56_003587 [Daphnia magna]